MIELPKTVQGVADTLRRAGFEAWIVGGCVRDSLLGRTPQDWDMCSDALPEETLGLFGKKNTVKAGQKHGTIGVITGLGLVEITTFRTEGAYQDNRHPDEVRFVRDIRSDLSRRDFTVNAMAYCREKGLLDLFGGQADLKAGIIRCVGEPEARFREDALRILRALRFAARYGFSIEEKTSAAADECRGELLTISGERIWAELKGIFSVSGAGAIVRSHFRIIGTVLPEADLSEPETLERYLSRCDGDFTVRLSLLFSDGADAKRALERLHADTESICRVSCAVSFARSPLPSSLPGLRREIARWGKQTVLDGVSRMKAAGERKEICAMLEELCRTETCFSVKELAVSGKDLAALGVPPGKEMGRLLNTLLEEIFDEKIPNDRVFLLAEAEKLLRS